MKTKQALLTLCSVLAVGALGAGTVAYTNNTKATPASAETDISAWAAQQTHVNIEDNVTGLDDLDIRSVAMSNKLNFDNVTINSDTDYTYEKDGGKLYVYTEANADYASATARNKNRYDGNLNFYANGSTYAANTFIGIPEKDHDALMSFRTTWWGGGEDTMGMWLMARGDYDATTRNIRDWFCGYTMKFGWRNVSFYAPGSTTALTRTTNWNNSHLSSGDEIIVTYGVVDMDTDNDDVVDTARMYLCVQNITKNLTLPQYYDYTLTGTEADNTTEDGSQNTFGIRMYHYDTNAGASRDISGVNRPLILDYDAGEAEAGTAVSSLSLPTGYTLKDASGTIAVGENSLAATHQLSDYYGAATTATDCTVSVTGQEVDITAWAAEQTHVNIEDNVDSWDDLDIRNLTMNNKIDMSTATLNGLTNANGGFYLYTQANADYATADAMNHNRYDGNLSFASDKTSSYGANSFLGIPEKDHNALMSFRTTWWGGNADTEALYLMARGDYDAAGTANSNIRQDKAYGWGYIIKFGFRSLYFYATDGDKSASTAQYSYTAWNSNHLYAGDELLITYGVVDLDKNGDGTTDAVRMYFKLVNETKNATFEHYYDHTLTAGEITTTVDGTQNTFGIRIYAYRNYGAGGRDICGVNRPFVQAPAYTDATEYDEDAYATLADVTLNSGWAWKDASTALVYGTNSYDATYTYDYYGNSVMADGKVTLTVTGERIKITYQDKDGYVIDEVEVKAGEIELADYNNPYAQTVGWFVGDKLYPVGGTITVEEATTCTLAEIDLSIDENVTVRTNKEGGYNYGIRFLAKANTEQLVALGTKATFNGMIAPYDQIDGDFVVGMSGEYNTVALNNTLTDGDYTCGYITFTNILYENFNRLFSARTFVTVSYDDGSTATFYSAFDAEKNSACILELVKENVKNEEFTGEFADEIFAYYVDSTVEVVYDAENGTVAVVEYQDGYEFERTYTIVDGSVSVDGSTVSMQVNLTIADGVYDTTTAPNVPLIVYGTDGTVLSATYNTVSYADGVATITFTLEG